MVVAVDFDGCIAYGAGVKIRYAKQAFGIELRIQETAEETFPHGKQAYRRMMDAVGSELIGEYELAPNCREVLARLAKEGARIFVVTSRYDRELEAAKWFIQKHSLPITDVRNTNDAPKRTVLKEILAAAMLEDTLSKLVQLEGAVPALYFMKQPWNLHEQESASQLQFIAPVNDWVSFYSSLTGKDFYGKLSGKT